jgi:diguanylate cyclase (GGDEF)-like protein
MTMTIDLYTIQLAMTTVTMVAGVMFILDTFLRKTDAAGRVWAVSFMSGILAAFAYAAWIVVPGAWWAVAIGNAAIVLSPALLWGGARAFNGRPDLAWIGILGSAAAGIAVLAAGPDGGDWAGAAVMFALIAVFASLGAAESLRPPMRENWTARGLTVMFVVVALFYATRTLVFLLRGPEDPVFMTFLGTEASAFVLISLVIVTLASLLILQSERAPRTPGRQEMAVSYNADAVLIGPSFREIIDDWLERANFHDEQLVFMRVELDELDALNTAFGRSVGTQLLGEFTTVVRRYSSPHSDIGTAGRGALVVVAPFGLLEHATADAEAVQAGLREHRIEAAQGIRLSASIGIAGTDRFGYDFDRLMGAAGEAASAARAAGGDAIALAE